MVERGRRVLVTGAAGFIGRRVVEALARRGDQPVALVRPGGRQAPATAPETVTADVADAAAVARAIGEAQADAVVHGAASVWHPETPEERTLSLRVSVDGTAAVLRAASERGLQMVHLGSSLEYGPYDRPIREDDQLRPTTVRGAHKAAAALLVGQAAQEGLEVTILRPFSVYGPEEPSSRLVPTAIRAALLGVPLPLTHRGIRRDLVHVDDVADAILRVLDLRDRVRGETFNLGTETDLDNHEIVDAVSTAVGLAIEIEEGGHPGRPPDTSCWVADSRHARRVLGWSARPLAEGLESTVSWWAERVEIAV